MIKAVVFDIGNVMVDYDWRKTLLLDLGMTEEQADALGEAVFENPYMNEYDRGALPDREVIEIFCKANPDMEKEIRFAFEHMPETLTEFPDSPKLIRALKKAGYQVYYLSNYSESNFRIAREQFQFLKEVDGGVVSWQEKITKPEPGIYQALLSRYGLKPEEVLFFDDLPRNIKGAKKAGFHTWQVTTKPSIYSIKNGLAFYGIQIEL